MITYSLGERGSAPLYVYLYECIRRDILSGHLKQGEKLPSKRSLASHHGISVITVENAYAQLLVEGYIRSEEKKGYFVAGGDSVRVFDLPPQKETGEQNEKEEREEVFADLVRTGTLPSLFPFATWSTVMRRILQKKDPALLHKAPAFGLLPLRHAIADHLRRFRAMNVKAEQVFIGAGTEYLYGILALLLGREKCYAVEDPGYHKVYHILKDQGVKVLPLPMDEEGILISALQASEADIIHLSPSHHYPTGIVTSIQRRAELLSYAEEKEGRYLIEDEYDSEFRFRGRPIPGLFEMKQDGPVVLMNTFSKTLTPSIRISYMVLPESLLERAETLLSSYASPVASFEQMALAAFMEEGAYDRHLNRLKTLYKKKRNLLLKNLRAAGFSVKVEPSGLHFLLPFSDQLPDRLVKDAMKAEGIRVSALSDYQYEARGDSHQLLISYSSVPDEIMEELALRMKRAMEEANRQISHSSTGVSS